MFFLRNITVTTGFFKAMDFQSIDTKTPPAKALNAPPVVFDNTSQYKPKSHNNVPDSEPELIILK